MKAELALLRNIAKFHKMQVLLKNRMRIYIPKLKRAYWLEPDVCEK